MNVFILEKDVYKYTHTYILTLLTLILYIYFWWLKWRQTLLEYLLGHQEKLEGDASLHKGCDLNHMTGQEFSLSNESYFDSEDIYGWYVMDDLILFNHFPFYGYDEI